jgi:hypothetical protein
MIIGAADEDRREIGVPSFARHWAKARSLSLGASSTIADIIARMHARQAMHERHWAMFDREQEIARDD